MGHMFRLIPMLDSWMWKVILYRVLFIGCLIYVDLTDGVWSMLAVAVANLIGWREGRNY